MWLPRRHELLTEPVTILKAVPGKGKDKIEQAGSGMEEQLSRGLLSGGSARKPQV